MNLQQQLKQLRQDKESTLYAETRSKIQTKLDRATTIEGTRGLSIKEAQAAMKEVEKLRAEAAGLSDWLNSAEFSILNVFRKDQDELDALREVAALQGSLIEEDAGRQQEIDSHLENSVNLLVGVDKRDLRRQLERLRDGEGMTDAQGRLFVRFETPDSGGIKRCVQLASGKFGFLTESRSDGTGE